MGKDEEGRKKKSWGKKKSPRAKVSYNGIYQSKRVLEWHISNFRILGGTSQNAVF